MRQRLGRHAFAGIGHGDQDVLARGELTGAGSGCIGIELGFQGGGDGGGRDADRAAVRQRIDGIGDEAIQDLGDPVGIARS